MCLDTITKRLKPAKLMTFYKIMRKTENGQYISQYRFCGRHKPQKAGGTFRRSSGGNYLCGQSYTLGFHGWTLRKVAEEYKTGRDWLALVKCEGHVHTVGEQSGDSVLVARDMRIVKEIRSCRERVHNRGWL